MNKIFKEGFYVAIRKTEGREWAEPGTLDILPELSKAKADATDANIPAWAKYNPLLRIAKVELHEINI